MFKVKINNEIKEFDKPIRAMELISEEDKYEYFACTLNYRLRELTYIINSSLLFNNMSKLPEVGLYIV